MHELIFLLEKLKLRNFCQRIFHLMRCLNSNQYYKFKTEVVYLEFIPLLLLFENSFYMRLERRNPG